MACFTVPAATAIGVAVARHIAKRKEKKEVTSNNTDNMKTSKKLGILELALYGGSFLLAGEHILHGEVTFTFPFLTAINEGPDAIRTMLFEMGTVGVTMTLAIVAVWGAALLFRKLFLKRRKAKEEVKE